MRRRLFGLCWILVVAVWVGGCTQASIPTPSPSPSHTVDYAAIETVIEDKIGSGSATLDSIQGVFVSVDGKTVIGHYRNGFSATRTEHVWSVTKSVVAILIGIAIADGKIVNLAPNPWPTAAQVPQRDGACSVHDHAPPAHVHDRRH
jgi:CubicO group peptidase (beta-lactamase class C family)